MRTEGKKELHLGHVGGVFIHADTFARFLRDRIGGRGRRREERGRRRRRRRRTRRPRTRTRRKR